MPDIFEFDSVDSLAAGAIGVPGQRTFMIQAMKGGALLSVLVEKEQVQLLATEATRFLDRIAADDPEDQAETPNLDDQVRDTEPLFRARAIGIGYDPNRRLVLLELRERADDLETENEDDDDPDDEEPGADVDAGDARVARIFATRAQVRAMARAAVVAVSSGRPKCPLCDFPMDPEGHRCPRWN